VGAEENFIMRSFIISGVQEIFIVTMINPLKSSGYYIYHLL
jgi:hypothetical protein